MEATGSDGGRGPSLLWSYHRGNQIGSNSYGNSISSSSSGTIVSTTYTSGGSRLSSISMDAVRHFELALDELLDEDTEECVQPIKKSCRHWEERTKHMDIESLVREFFGAPSAECSINISRNNCGDMSVLEWWFSELGVSWALHLPDDDASEGKLEHTSAASSWIRGPDKILETIPVPLEQGKLVIDTDKQANVVLDQIQLARFIKEAVSKMLPFVDIFIRQVVVSNNWMPPAPYRKLHSLLAVYEALSHAPARISVRSVFHSTSEGVRSIHQDTAKLLSAKWEEALETIQSTMESIRTRVLESIDIEYVASSDIHKATLSVMEYISFLSSNSTSMRQIVSKAVSLSKYVPEISQEKSLDSMIMDMKSCLVENLVKMSESFLDEGLRFLFLLNNVEFIRQSLMGGEFCYCLLYHEKGEGLAKKVEGYMESYLHACWEPVLSCLFSPTPLCFGINHSPLLKFEFEFKKTYTTQKLWKVPDSKLRKRLRTAITEKIVPKYTEYIEENNISTPGVAPQDLEKMLQELFEG